MNKKGVLNDGALLLVGFFFIAIATLVIFIVLDSTNTALQEQPLITQSSKQHFDDFNTAFPSVFDWVFVTVFIGLVLAGIVISYIVPANPLIFIFMIFVTIIFAAVGGFMSNAWDSATSEGVLANAASNSFPMTDFILNNYLLFIVVIFFLMVIVFYGKPEGGLN